MSESKVNSHLVSFEGVSASVGGFDISAIVEMRLQAAANTVPQITLLVDIGPDGGSEAIEAVSLGNASQVFNACKEMVRKDEATLSLSVSCRIAGPTGQSVQTLSIEGWLLTDVALSPIKREGVCTASLTFRHPLFKAHLGGSVPGLVADDALLNNVEDANPLGVFVRALHLYASSMKVTALPVVVPDAVPPSEMHAQLVSRLTKAASDLESALQWTHGSLPGLSYMAGWADCICRGIARYAEPSCGNSVLQVLLGGLVPECSLAIGGDYTKGALEIGPFEPWADASLTVADSDILSMDFPQTDPSPISGVRLVLATTESDKGSSYFPGFCQVGNATYPAEAFYVPQSERDAQYLYGPIQQFTEPGWLVSASQFANSKSAAPASDAVQSVFGGLKTATTTPRGGDVSFHPSGNVGQASLDYANAALACAKAYFETSLMKDWVFTATTRLMFSTDGGVICPCRAVRITADGKEVLGGYVAGVEHIISVPSKSATTRVICTHPRLGGIPSAISSPTNALYM